jgi:hypothetical protein
MKQQGFKILEYNDISRDIETLQQKGWDSGVYVGFERVAKHYNILPGSCTDYVGYPQSGKTELCLELLLNTSEFYGWKHLLFVPDIGTSLEVMAKLIHKSTGKTFKKQYPNHIDIKTAFNACTFLLEHFKIIHKTDPKIRLTPLDIWTYAVELKKKERIDTVMIDSWKDLYHDYSAYGGDYAKYLSSILPMRNEIAESSGLHLNTIIHPKNPVRNKDGKIRPPFADDMEGGAQWNNSGKSIIAVHRESPDENVSDIYFRKIKPEAVGRATATAVCLQFDYATSRYYVLADDGVTKMFATKTRDQKPTVDFSEPRYKQDLPF